MNDYDLGILLLSLLLTPVAYMTFPLIKLAINHGKFEKKRAQKISLWNSIVVGAVFCILTIESGGAWSAGPAAIYFCINRAILTAKNVPKTTTASNNDIYKKEKNKKIWITILKVVGALFLGIITADALLLIFLGDSVEGASALLLVCFFGILFAVLYYYLFSSIGRKKKEEHTPISKNAPQQNTETIFLTPPQNPPSEAPQKHDNYNVLNNDTVNQSTNATPTVIFCWKCGTKLITGGSFCHNCGAKAMIGDSVEKHYKS